MGLPDRERTLRRKVKSLVRFRGSSMGNKEMSVLKEFFSLWLPAYWGMDSSIYADTEPGSALFVLLNCWIQALFSIQAENSDL